ncbi:MAG TPA: permease-like cell division protein FtsX [Candidatus Dormibacteraeota bacterium]|jgi:cell division transport system permease protein|nr:permease-like cell division protein FtsX [Candidatus Dormibacteraeota bacterium]
MRIWRNLHFALESAWQSFCRNAAVSLAAVISITLILALAGVSLLLGHALNQVLDAYKVRVSVINISVADNTPLNDVNDFAAQLRADPKVAHVQFVSKQEALAQFTSDPANAAVVKAMDGNPLAAKLEVTATHLSDVGAIDVMARQWPGVDKSNPTDYQGEFISRMLVLSTWVELGGLGLLAILVVISIVIVMNTIRTAVYHRRKEIEVMKLVGATEWFVRWPFVMEGVITGGVAGAVAVGLLTLVYHPFIQQFQGSLFFLPLSYDPQFAAVLGQRLLLAGALLGAFGSFIGVRRFVRI